MEKNSKFFKAARKCAELSDFKRIHIGCVAVYKGKIISTGHNTDKTHPKQKKYNCHRDLVKAEEMHHTIHAEIMCLNKLDKDIQANKIKLYIYRIRRDIPHGMARPCAACMAKIKDLGIKNIYYTTDDGYAYEKITL